MGTCLGGVKLSRIAYFEASILSAAGKDHMIFKGVAPRPKPLSKGWYAEMERLALHCKEVVKTINLDDPIECFYFHSTQGKPLPSGRCSEVADAFNQLRDGIKSLDDEELALWNLERPECMTLEYHLDTYINELMACHSKRPFMYSV